MHTTTFLKVSLELSPQPPPASLALPTEHAGWVDERVTAHLPTWLELSTSAFAHNIHTLDRWHGTTPWGAVIKSNAYGHGFTELLSLIQLHQTITWIFVSSIEEGLRARVEGWAGELLIFSPAFHGIEDALNANMILSIYSDECAQRIGAASRHAGIRARVHIFLDCGMNHLGIPFHQSSAFIADLLSTQELQIEGVFTHLPDTSNPDPTVTAHDLQQFLHATDWLLPYGIARHACASGSAGMIDRLDLGRIGTSLYGSWKSSVHYDRLSAQFPGSTLRPIATWKSRILQLKNLGEEETVGYNRSFRATRDMRIAIVASGYDEGFTRSNSNRGIMLVHGTPCPVVGIVSMNMCAIDVTKVSNAGVGDEVILMGEHPLVTPGAIAERLATNPNEITTALRTDLPRIIVP